MDPAIRHGDRHQPGSLASFKGCSGASFAAAEERREQQFWLSQLNAALTAYVCAALVFLLYCGFTWTRPNRSWILVICLTVLLFLSPSIFVLRRRIVALRHRLLFFYAWMGLTFPLVTLVCYLDGGLASPAAWLLFLPMLYIGLAYPLSGTLFCGLAGLACFFALAWVTRGAEPYSVMFVQLSMLTIGFVLAVIGAKSRETKDNQRRRLGARLERMASMDTLTGCLNQQAFMEALEREVERSWRYGRVLSLLVIDVDHFKNVNDRYGHLMGNDVLREVGRALRQVSRRTDVAGRPGGDEFSLLAPETDSEAVWALAERMRDMVKELPLPIDVTLSIGVCSLRPDSQDAEVILRSADEALYEAKRLGRDRIQLSDLTAAARVS